MSRKTSKPVSANLADALIANFSALQGLLDTIPDTRSESQKAASEDTRDFTKRQDIGMRILLDQCCRAAYYQLYGQIESKTSGEKVPNITQRLADQQSRLDKALEDYANDPVNAFTDPRVILTNHWYEVAAERVTAVHNLLDSFKHAYEFFVGEPWKAPANMSTVNAPVRKVELSDEEKKAAEAKMAAIMARKQKVSAFLPPAH
jgi:hypothetical protein